MNNDYHSMFRRHQVCHVYNDAISHKVLENCRFTYDNKYKENFINLYKYLNSSIELLKECLKMHSNEIQMKCILLKKEGNDLW